MLDLTDLHIEYSGTNAIKVEWEFKNTFEDINDYEVDVYRSESPGANLENAELDGYDLVQANISLNNTFYLDESVAGIYDPNRSWYYKLVVRNISSGDQSVQPENGAYVKQKLPDYRSKYIVRWKNRALDQYVGRDMLLLKRRTWGEKCEEEWDEITQRYSGNKCDTCNCFGTGLREGFFAPIDFKGMINPRPKRDEITMFGEFKPSDVVLYVTNFPPMRPSDVVVEDEKAYIVLQVQPVERLGFTVEQRVQMSLLHPDDEVNRDWDIILDKLEVFLIDDQSTVLTDGSGNQLII